MKLATFMLVVAAIVVVTLACFTLDARANRGHGALGTVYVTSQGLYYDTFVSVESLPPRGKFQYLAGGETEFGPGDPGYRGGRWWTDDNGNGEIEEGETLLCPLLPPGRLQP